MVEQLWTKILDGLRRGRVMDAVEAHEKPRRGIKAAPIDLDPYVEPEIDALTDEERDAIVWAWFMQQCVDELRHRRAVLARKVRLGPNDKAPTKEQLEEGFAEAEAAEALMAEAQSRRSRSKRESRTIDAEGNVDHALLDEEMRTWREWLGCRGPYQPRQGGKTIGELTAPEWKDIAENHQGQIKAHTDRMNYAEMVAKALRDAGVGCLDDLPDPAARMLLPASLKYQKQYMPVPVPE